MRRSAFSMNQASANNDTATGQTEFIDQVSELLQRDYGIDWNDACGDMDPIEFALRDGLSPADFVEYWAEKYDLVRTADSTNCW